MNDSMNVEVELPGVGAPEWMDIPTPEDFSASAEAAEHAMQTSFEEQEREAQARELEERKQRETMQRGYEALSVGWGNPHEGSEVKAKRRKNAVDAFGEEYVSMYEQAPEPEQKRAVADRFLTDYYTEAGDEVFSPELRFAEAYGIDPNSDIKEHIYQRFIESSRVRHEFDTRIENMREEEMQWIGRYLAGKEEMTAEKGEIIVGLFGQEMVERIAKVRDASQLIEEFVKHGEGESKTAGVLLWEEAVYDAVVNPETGEMDNVSRVLMTLALRGIAEDVQAEGREANALQAGKGSLDMAVRRLLWNISNEDSAEYEAALSNLAIYERLATDEGYAASRMTQEQYDALRAKGGRDAAIRLMHAQLYDPEELRRIREELLPAARIDMKKRTSRKVVRGMLQNYVAQANASPEGTSWYKQALKGVGEMAGITAPYLIPFAGIYAGTISSIVSASDSNLNANLAAGLSKQAALNSARQNTLIAAAVELMPWSRVGGRGFNATIGRALTSAGYKPGTFAAKIADFASKGTGHAFATEVIGGVVDEGILEPLGQGLLTMTTDAAMDALGVEKAESRTFGEAFAELREVWTNPSQLAALVLFTEALTSARLPQMYVQSKEFAQFLRDNAASAGTWEALGLSDSDVRKIEASDNPLLTGRALFKRALEKDPEGVKERMRKQGLRLQEEGFTLRLTGTTGELDANAEAAWAESYREMVELGYMPHVERIADQNGQSMYRITERDKLTKEVKSEQEMTGAQADVYLQLKMNQADNIMLERHRKTVYKHMSQYVYQLAGAAMGRELEQKGASEGLTTSDLNEAGEGIGEKVQAEGGLSYATMLLAAERLGGRWKARAQSLLQRIKGAGMTDTNTQGSAAFRERSGINVQRNGRSVIGSLVLHSKGNATPLEYMEESVESFIDMWVQVRAAETGKSEQESWAEFADIVRQAREELIKLEPSLEIQELPERPRRQEIIETMSDMGRARFINSPLLPAWMAQVQDMVSAAVEEAAMATRIHEAAKKAEKEGLPAWQQMEEIFKSFDVPMGNIYSAARIDAQIIEQVRLARARIGGRQVATTAAEVQDKQAEDAARDEQLEREEAAYAAACPEPPKAEGKSTEEQKADMLSITQPRNVPGSIKGVFVNDSYAEYPAAGYYAGWVPIKNLRDSKEVAQVKAGSKGKHGVVNPITGEYQQETEAIYVWLRKDGTLEVISGRHKYALALENGTEAAMCYVFVEDAQHDAKWARLLDFENNMRGDQADELTAAIYVRETGYDDATLRKKGLMRNKSKSKRGILIGREARQELWDRFVNGAVNAMDAETICTMTQNVRDKSRVEEIQRRCCMLLEQGKSWDYISAMVQLMANKESVFMRQGLLDLGADFEADMERAAAYVEKCVQKLTEAIGIIKSGRRLSGEKKKLAERLGQNATSAEASEAKLNDLITMREKFRNIGAYPDLVAAASMWDGKTELDPIAMAFSDAHSELEQAAAEAGMTREEWEEAQAEKAAKQAAEEGTGSLFGSYSLRDISSVRSVVDDLLKGEAKGVLKDTKWGRDISVPKGRTGSKHGYGIKHIQEKRIMQGLEDDEAAFVVVCALAAAQSVEPTDGPRQKKHFERFGIRTVVAESEDRGNPVVTGFVIYDKEKTGEDGSAVAYSAQQIYALQELRSSQEVGASLGVALARFEGIVKQYPTIWERVIEFEVEKLKLKIEAKKLGSFMKAPNGQPTNLTEQQWLTVQTEAFKAWFGDSKVLDENGEPKVVYHGTARADRVGTVFRPDRATSGPMAFFTDNQAIAGNYARDKQDTSMAYDEVDYNDYRQQFRVKLPNGLDIPLHRYWGHLPFDERRRIAKVAGHIREDWEGDGDIIVDEETNDGTGGFSWNLKEARGNALDALIEEWLMSGNLFDNEARFLDVLAKLELPIQPYYKDPNYREEKVYACFMNIANPFRTGRLTKKIVASLRAASKKAKRTESQQADLWDKNSRTPERWMEMLEEDYANGTDFSWTSIPDWVTDWMKKKGYDGIVDRGGKHHDIGHTVYIPFDSVQVKSATDNRGTFDPQNPDITFSLRSMTESARVVLRRREDDAVGMALSRAKGELEQAAAEAGMTREEWEEAQAEKAAKQAAEEGTRSLFGSYSTREVKSAGVDAEADDIASGTPGRSADKVIETHEDEIVKEENEGGATFSVIGEHARTWSKYKDKAFTGRDDGKMRAELDASKARIIAPTFPAITERAVRYTMHKFATDDERKLLDKYRRMKRLFDSYMKQLKEGTLTERQTNNWKAKSREIDDIRESLGGLVERTLNSLGYHASIQKFLPGIHRTYHPGIVEDVLDGRMEHLHDTLSRNMWVPGSTLEDVLDFPELYEAYPRLRDMEIKVEDTGDADAVFYPGDFSIALSYNKLGQKLPLKKHLADILHEVQHAIQEIEGFAKGGSERQFRKNPDGLVNISAEIASAWMMKADRVWDSATPETQKKFREINFAIIKKEYEKVNELEEALSESERAAWEEYREMKSNAYRATQDGGVQVTPYEAYYRLAGEIEARNVEHRMGWSAEGRAATPFNFTLDYSDGAITSFSLRSMTESARVVLRRREDDVEGEELIKRWDDLLARFETASTDKHDGAAQLGTLVSLLEATRSVLPPDFAKLGRLTALMKWASVYAHMVSTGEVKRDGVLKGEIFEKFVAAMKREYEGGLLKGLSEEEAREAVQSIGERRLEDALIKVANECRARLDVFVKARARERIELMAERAYPKKKRGQKSPRGKMESIYYRAMNTMLKWMDAPAEKVVARVNELRGRLDALDAAGVNAEYKGATREELEEELRIVQLYGRWADMSAAQAKQAAEDFVTFVLTQRHAWDARLEMERRRRDYQRLRMRFTQPYNSNTRSDLKRKDSNWKVHKFSINSLLVNTMSYSQLMLAGRKVFGEQFVRLRLQEIADANAALSNARSDRDNFFARAVMAATGLSGEGELSRWLNKFAKVETKTGIFKREITLHTLEMERREAEEWCAMTAEERAERREELEKEAAATGLAPSNVPSEADIDLLRQELAALDERESTAQKVEVLVPRHGQMIELVASRDAVANAILLLEQEDYQHLIEYEGFVPRDKNGKVIDRELFPDEPLDVEQTLKPLYDFIGKEGRAFAYALRRYVGQNGKQMQAVYEAQMGIPLAMKPNYWRGNFNINTIKEKDTMSESNGAVGGGGYGFLIDRVRHYNRLEWSNTATMVFGATVEMQNNYTYTSGITREWRALLSDTGFQKRMEVELGRNYMTALKAWLEVIDKSKGGFAAFADIATWTQRMSRGLAYAALAGNGFALLKQSSAILHGLMGGEVPRAVVERGDGVRELTWRKIGAAEYAAAMARTKAGMGAISLKELADCEWFQARTDAEYKNVASRMSKLEGQKQHAYATKVAEKSMDAIGWVDRAVNLLGMQALADAVYRDMARLNKENELGLTEEQMKGEALAAVGRALTLTAQPNEASEKSLFAAQGGLISNMLFQFKSETVNKLGLLIARCYAGDWVAGIRDYMTFGAMNTLIAAALAWLRYGDEPEEDEEWKYFTKYGLNAIFGDLAAMPLVGEMVQSATSAVTGEYIYQRGFIANYIDPRGIWRSAERLATGEKGSEELDWHGYVKEANALARRLSVLCAFLGEGATWAELMLSAAAAGNIIRTGADAYEGVTREEDE